MQLQHIEIIGWLTEDEDMKNLRVHLVHDMLTQTTRCVR